VRAWPAIALFVAALSACGSETSRPLAEAPGPEARVERCIERLLQRAASQEANAENVRSYVRETYCARFALNGWVYDDGALRLAAHHWLEQGMRCATANAGEPARTIPCEEAGEPRPRVLDCALLHHVRRSEVVTYLEQLRRKAAVRCDDETPLDELGVP
jgi:hypothetical protein